MTPAPPSSWDGLSPRLHSLQEGDRSVPATEALGDPPAVYGERVVVRSSGSWRRWDPYRSKLAAALVRGYRGPVPQVGQRWLYLGAATGTTASHLADLVGPEGAVYAVELSLRPFTRLLRLASRYPNLLPILADARVPDQYAGLVPPVDGLYSDIAQPDQVTIARSNAELLLRDRGTLVLVLKLASLRRDRTADVLTDQAVSELGPFRPVTPVIALEPFHRQHRLLAARSGDAGPRRSRPLNRRKPYPAGRRR